MVKTLLITNNKIKDIVKVIESLKNRGALLKWITTKIICQEVEF